MPIFKIVNKPYQDKDDLKNLLYYVLNPQKLLYAGGKAVMVTTVPEIITQFHTIKSFYCKEDGRQLIHCIISFSDYESNFLTKEQIIKTGQYFSGEVSQKYQIVYGIHGIDGFFHLHFIINSVSYIDGKKYRANRDDTWWLNDCAYLSLGMIGNPVSRLKFIYDKL